MRLKDIAEKVGVSTSTVSRVLNDRDTKAASKKVKERVWQAVREAGYTPDEAARELRTRSFPSWLPPWNMSCSKTAM